MEAVARRFDDSPFEAESILSDSEATELKERLVLQEGAAFVLDLLRRIFPEGTSSETKLEFMEVQPTVMDDHNLALFGLK